MKSSQKRGGGGALDTSRNAPPYKLACSRLAEKHAQIRSLNGPSQCMHGHMNMPRVECMHS